jgi:hypothetical protein
MILSVSLFYHNSAMSASSSTKKRCKPRGIWKAQRVIAPRLPARPTGPRHSPKFASDSDDSDGASTCSTASNTPRPYSPSQVTYEEDTSYGDYSRGCSPYPDRVNSWVARTKIMDISTMAGPGSQPEHTTYDNEDWEDLKDLFAKVAEHYESG